MIPKVIHYCWFGGGPRPGYIKKCIDSWIKFFPDYQIKEWNERNFDVNILPYTRDAYAAKKYAFVSDVARFWVLYHEGGLYFDADVEVVASFDDILAVGPFMGVEVPSQDGNLPLVNPGVGLASEAGNNVIKKIYDHYATQRFILGEDEAKTETVVIHTTRVLSEHFALQPINEIQKLDGITIYPVDYFNPFNDLTGSLNKTKNTHSIHWFAKSWTNKPFWYYRVTRIFHRIFGIEFYSEIKSFFASKRS